MKAREIVTGAMQDIGAFGGSDTLVGDDATLALDRLNAMIRLWSMEPSAILVPGFLSIPLTSGLATYTVGPSGSTVTPRPARVLPGSYITYQGINTPLGLVNYQDFAANPFPTQPGLPFEVWYQQTTPNATVVLFPVPGYTSMVLNLATDAAILQFTDLDTDVPGIFDGYRLPLQFNLACLLSLPFARPVSPELRLQAANAKRTLWAINNIPLSSLNVSNDLPGGYGFGVGPLR